MSMERLMKSGRVAALALALTFGTAAVTNVAAQETPSTEDVNDDGFDDWGLLGLLGLAGLLGLKRRNDQPEVRVERPRVEQR
jgi:MYXO-CTERM domain-containing protein